ncbi:histamine N-methyltransferase isoform X2 [Austrofundulus limnaeus]|uniref:Histamine N-methyltransferase isoform X2 n=1 Tax=Austrofundulus limnaeus TaxID=52670 RepID=A0A2I4C6D7_AUSLI|nr:PREDICTED: histamine N-methyltransferase-like isoform X2 [Austrofundulus limnaeus]
MASPLKSLVHDDSRYQTSFQLFLQRSSEHQCVRDFIHNKLADILASIGDGKSHLNVIGVGSGAGEIDLEMLSELHKRHPDVTVDNEVVEPSSQQIHNYKALVAKTAELQSIPFSWHIMHSEDYEKQVKAKGDIKKFDFIHMIQMIYYVDDLQETIKFFQSLLKKNGRLMIVVESANSGWDILWKTYKKELCVGSIQEYRSSGEVVACLKSLGLKYEEHLIPQSFDITDCFDPSSEPGARLASFMTGTDRFHESFSPEIRAGMLDLLRNKCSTEKDGRVFFNGNMSCILIHA